MECQSIQYNKKGQYTLVDVEEYCSYVPECHIMISFAFSHIKKNPNTDFS